LVTNAVPDVHREAVDGSPSRDRLSRIAAMIRDAERAGEASHRRPQRGQAARLIPLATRRRARLRAEGIVELAG
jgi:hypothetical protein